MVDIAWLAGVGALTGIAFGVVMDVWNWTFYAGSPQLGWHSDLAPGPALARFARYYLVTSLGYDSFRAIGNALMVILLGLPILAGLGRIGRRFRLEWDDGHLPGNATSGPLPGLPPEQERSAPAAAGAGPGSAAL
jgi:energy-coupling factor transport system substrate-specific component